MKLTLYAHPFSSYCQKVFIALYENATPFDLRELAGDPAPWEELAAHWPLRKMPLLVDGARAVMEASIIIEYLHLHHPGPVQLLPVGAEAALDVRSLDRVFDNYIATPMQRIVAQHMRAEAERDAPTLAEAHAMLETSYGWLERHVAGREWACDTGFSLADCAAAPALFYSDWVHPISASYPQLAAYRARLLARPSFASAVEQARPFRKLFPPGAPDRD
jgi:glutathione S-transferase